MTTRTPIAAAPVAGPDVDALVARAWAAQLAFEGWSEARVDQLLLSTARCIDEHAEELAAASVAETGYGNVADKATKNRVASLRVYRAAVRAGFYTDRLL